MNRMDAIEELAEKWAEDNHTIILLSNPPQTPRQEVKKAFIGGFMTAMDLSKDAWDSGYEAGKAYGMAMVEGKDEHDT